MRGYKGFNADMTCRGFQYEVGQTYEMDGEIEPCVRGFHFCRTMAQVFDYYRGTDKRYAEVEALGDIEEDDDKCVTNKIKIIREIPHDEAVQMTNTGNWNTGDWNTGDWNTGNWNTGDRNTGDRNTGHRNTGDRNTGHRNTGNCNTGDWNTGDWNTGDWNVTDFSSGCFNTAPQKITLFNKPSNWVMQDWLRSDARYILNDMPQEIDAADWVPAHKMTDEEKGQHPEHKTTGGYLKITHRKADRQAWWDALSEDKKATVKALPNFDADIFRECTGIQV